MENWLLAKVTSFQCPWFPPMPWGSGREDTSCQNWLVRPHPSVLDVALWPPMAGHSFSNLLYTRPAPEGQSVVRVLDNLCRTGSLCG